EIAVRAAIQLIDPQPAGAEMGGGTAVRQYAAFLERTLPPQLREQLAVLVRRLGPTVDLVSGLARWARAACFTSIRAGLLLAGDLEVAVRLGQTAAAAAGIDPADVIRDLVAWSISEGYFELRAQLGLRTVNLDFRGSAPP
ncbi:MAG TPA: hypothetical protein VIJ59_00180, partial [Caulobacteraceae bacterium]